MMDCGGPDPEDPSGKREAARMGAIAIGMASAEYRFYTAAVPRDQRWDSAPGTPDAMHHTLSRRQWKAAVHEWRKRHGRGTSPRLHTSSSQGMRRSGRTRSWTAPSRARWMRSPRDKRRRLLPRPSSNAASSLRSRLGLQRARARLGHQLRRAVLTLLISSVPLSNVWVLTLVAEANGSTLSRRGEVTARSRDQP